MITFEQFSENLKKVQERMQTACDACGRSVKDVMLLPVTKNHPSAAVEYVSRAGIMAVAENRVKEAVDKKAELSVGVKWELIGHLQSNKAKIAVENFDRIQTVDSLKLAKRLDHLAVEQGRVLPVLIQVNAGQDPAKFGIECEEASSFFATLLGYKNIQIDGLMSIAPLDEDKSVAAKSFNKLRQLRDDLEEEFSMKLTELSMGMTDDMEEAIKAGSTMIRVGTALFGFRK